MRLVSEQERFVRSNPVSAHSSHFGDDTRSHGTVFAPLSQPPAATPPAQILITLITFALDFLGLSLLVRGAQLESCWSADLLILISVRDNHFREILVKCSHHHSHRPPAADIFTNSAIAGRHSFLCRLAPKAALRSAASRLPQLRRA